MAPPDVGPGVVEVRQDLQEPQQSPSGREVAEALTVVRLASQAMSVVGGTQLVRAA